jgi:hypothetical protein
LGLPVLVLVALASKVHANNPPLPMGPTRD